MIPLVGQLKRTPADLYAEVPEPSSKRIKIDIPADIFPNINDLTRIVAIRQFRSKPKLLEQNRNVLLQHKDPDSLSCAMIDLASRRQLTQKNFKAVAAHEQLENLGGIFFLLFRREFFKKETLEFVLRHRDPFLVATLVNLLYDASLLTKEVFELVVKHKQPAGLLAFFCMLKRRGELTVDDLRVAFQIRDFTFLIRVGVILSKAGILTNENLVLANRNQFTEAKISVLKLLQNAKRLTEVTYRDALRSKGLTTIENVLDRLVNRKIFHEKIWEIVIREPFPELRCAALTRLADTPELLSDQNVIDIFSSQTPTNYASAIKILHFRKEIPPELREFVLTHTNPVSCAQAILTLIEESLFTRENVERVLSHPVPEFIAKTMVQLSRDSLLTLENLDLASKHQQPLSFAISLKILHSSEILTREYISIMMDYEEPAFLAGAISILRMGGILNQENLNDLMKHQNPTLLAEAFVMLNNRGLLSQENRAIVVANVFPLDHAKLLCVLNDTVFLSEENRGLIKRLTDDQCKTLWSLYEAQLLKQKVFDWLRGKNGIELATALLKLLTIELLSLEILEYLGPHKCPVSVVDGIIKLHQIGIMNEANLKMVMIHDTPFMLASSFELFHEAQIPIEQFGWIATKKTRHLGTLAQLVVYLHQRHMLNHVNREIAAQCKDKWSLNIGLRGMLVDELLTDDNFHLAACHSNPESFCRGMKLLRDLGILTETNRQFIINSSSPAHLVIIFQDLMRSKLLTEDNKKKVAAYARVEILSGAIVSLVGKELLTQEILEQLLEHDELGNYQKILTDLSVTDQLSETHPALAAKHPRLDLLAQAVKKLRDRGQLTGKNFCLIANRYDPCDALSLIAE